MNEHGGGDRPGRDLLRGRQTRLLATQLVVGLLLVLVVASVAGFLLWKTLPEPDVAPPAALHECMTTCVAWHLVGSLYHRGFCLPCEKLDVCAGQPREKPSPRCVDGLRSCYHAEKCMASVRVACDKRCTAFVQQAGRTFGM